LCQLLFKLFRERQKLTSPSWPQYENLGLPDFYSGALKNAIKAFVSSNLRRIKFSIAEISKEDGRDKIPLFIFAKEQDKNGTLLKCIEMPKTLSRKQCRWCGQVAADLKICRWCAEYQDYPDAHFYCSENDCEERSFDAVHYAEHYDFLVRKLEMYN